MKTVYISERVIRDLKEKRKKREGPVGWLVGVAPKEPEHRDKLYVFDFAEVDFFGGRKEKHPLQNYCDTLERIEKKVYFDFRGANYLKLIRVFRRKLPKRKKGRMGPEASAGKYYCFVDDKGEFTFEYYSKRWYTSGSKESVNVIKIHNMLDELEDIVNRYHDIICSVMAYIPMEIVGEAVHRMGECAKKRSEL